VTNSHSDALVFFGRDRRISPTKRLSRIAGNVEPRSPQCAGYRRRESWLDARPTPRRAHDSLEKTWRSGFRCLLRNFLVWLRYLMETTTICQFRAPGQELKGAQRQRTISASRPLCSNRSRTIGALRLHDGCSDHHEKPFGHDLAIGHISIKSFSEGSTKAQFSGSTTIWGSGPVNNVVASASQMRS